MRVFTNNKNVTFSTTLILCYNDAVTKKKARFNKVLLILRTTGSGREILQGALRYAQNDPYCSIQIDLMPDALTPEKVAEFARLGLSGILTSEIGMTRAVTDAFARLDIPMVVMSAPDSRLKRTRNLAFVGVDEEAIGAAGARHLQSLGSFNSFGFVASYRGLPWSDLRKQGFVHNVRAEDVRTFDGPDSLSDIPGSPEDLARLETWLMKLPKPAAVMADHDTRAAQVIECCRRLNLNIPEQIAVMGVDNDRVICDFTQPTLTSVQPDHEAVGYRAAAELSPLMHRHATERVKVVRCRTESVVIRESTHPLAPSGRLVREALAFIEQHACEGIRVTDVVKHLGVSRALADLRFREVEGRSILEAITDRRLEELTRRLTSTREPIARLSSACGFGNPNYLKRLFKSHYGMTLSAYRQQHTAAHKSH